MKIVNINSGLGNQMFQFAFYLSIVNKFKNEKIKLDISWFKEDKFHNGFELKRVFNINVCYSSNQENIALSRAGYTLLDRIKRRLLPSKKSEVVESKEQQFHFCEELYGQKLEDLYYRGYWQSYKYFESVSELIKNNFTFPSFVNDKNINLYSFMKRNRGQIVSIHVRKGDYLKHDLLGDLCTLDYYQKAIIEIKRKVENPIFIVFSDDVYWCKLNLRLSNAKFVDWNNKQFSFRDLQLMSLCDHNIIANSSFSWWGAYLNSNKNKIVIAPRIWIKGNDTDDIVPIEWKRL